MSYHKELSRCISDTIDKMEKDHGILRAKTFTVMALTSKKEEDAKLVEKYIVREIKIIPQPIIICTRPTYKDESPYEQLRYKFQLKNNKEYIDRVNLIIINNYNERLDHLKRKEIEYALNHYEKNTYFLEDDFYWKNYFYQPNGKYKVS